LTHAFWDNDIDIGFPNAQTTANTLSITYTKGTGTEYQKTARKAYGNASILGYASYNGKGQWADPNTSVDMPLNIGAAPNPLTSSYNNTNLKIQSVRIYNIPLDQDQINNNFEVDQNRFINPPTVKIGTETCTSLVVLSPTQMSCKTPAYTGIDPKPDPVNVSVTFGDDTVTLENAFTYQDMRLTDISPTSGPASGGQQVTITGEFLPYVSTTDYVQEGLVAHFDGINNTGQGDKFHDDNASEWRDLASSNTLELINNSTPANNWKSNGYRFGIGTRDYWMALGLASTFPLGNSDRTAEVVYMNPNVMGSNQTLSFVSPGNNTVPGTLFGQQYISPVYNIINAQGTGYNFNVNAANAPGINSPNVLHSVTATYGEKFSDVDKTNGYIDGVQFESSSARSDNPINTCSNDASTCRIYLGTWRDNGDNHTDDYTMLSYRIYDRILTSDEIAHNALLDQIRYTQVPKVEIGLDSSPGVPSGSEDDWAECVNVAILDSSTITCTTSVAPGSIVGQAATVRLTPYSHNGSSAAYYDLAEAYTYLDDTNLDNVIATIKTQTPTYLDASGGETLTFTGTNLDRVDSIMIGSSASLASQVDPADLDNSDNPTGLDNPTNSGNPSTSALPCTIILASQSATSLSCTTPAEVDYPSGNRKSLVITTNDSPDGMGNAGNTITGTVEYREFMTLDGLSDITLSSSKQTDSQTLLVKTNSQTGYSITVQTMNTTDTGRDSSESVEERSSLLCEPASGTKYYIRPIRPIPAETGASDASELPGGTYGIKFNVATDASNPDNPDDPDKTNYLQVNPNYFLPLSTKQLTLAEASAPTLGPTNPDSFPITYGVNTSLPAPACGNYTGTLRYTVVGR
jgi:hypothetical protein